MKAFLTAAAVVLVSTAATWSALRAFSELTALRYGNSSVVLLDHDIGIPHD